MNFVVRHISSDEYLSLDADFIDSPEVIKWWCFGNPNGDGVFAGVFSNSQLAGVASLTPKRFMIGGVPVIGAEIGHTITHQDFRGKGIFTKLVKHLVSVARDRGYQIIYGMPNEASGHIYIRSLKFEKAFDFDRFGRPINWARLGSPLGRPGTWMASAAGAVFDRLIPLTLGQFHYSVGQNVEPDLETFLSRAAQRFDCYIQRTADYVGWRFSRPNREYAQLYLRDFNGELRGWSVVRFVKQGGTQRVHIGDIWICPHTKSIFRAIIGAVALEGKKRSIDQIYAIARSATSRSLFQSVGFLRRGSMMPIIARSPTGFDLTRLRNWEFRDADADMF